ncbi:MAG: tetratricopeptide repeat protein [Pseudomonadota bacterium]
MEKGDFEGSRTILEGLKGKDDSKDLYFLLGFVYLKTARYEQAVDSLRAYEKLKPENDEYHYYLGVSLYELKRYDEALDEFNKSALSGVKVAASYYYSGYVHFTEDDCGKALPFFVDVLKEEKGDFTNLSHYYSGVCLYRDGFNDSRSFESAAYHFEKVLDDKGSISDEARLYLDAIKDYQENGAVRYKNRYNVQAEVDILYSSRRTINPIAGIPTLGLDLGTHSFVGRAALDLGISPMIYDSFALFISYAFKTDIAFDTRLAASDYQGHRPGLNFQFYNQRRTFQAMLGYYYEIDLVDHTSLKKIDNAHVIETGFDKSLTSTWAMGLKLPFRLYNGNGGQWGDFTGKSLEVSIYSYHIFGKTSFRFEPSALFYMASTGTLNSFKYYKFAIKVNLPWRVLFLWPSLNITPGKIVASTGNVSTYEFGFALFRPVGLGMRLSISSTARKGFVSNNWEVITGLGLEYVYQ